MSRLWLAVATALALVASAAPAPAQDDVRERSRAAFRRGVTQAETGDYRSARDSFLEAYRLFPHPSILLNLGIARGHTGQWVEAERDLVNFLADDGGSQPAELASARAELAQARSHLGTFRLRVAPGGARATLDERAVALLLGEFVDVRTTRGAHALHVEAAGFAPVDRSITVDAERAPNVDIVLRGAGGTAGSSAGAGSSAAVGPRSGASSGSTSSSASDADSSDGGRIAGWLLFGAGVVAAGVGTYAGLQATNLASDYNTPGNANYQDPSTKASGLVFRTSADAAFVGALALGGVGLYLLLTAHPSPAGPQARVIFGPVSGVAGSF